MKLWTGVITCCCMCLLAGCWDQRLLKESSLILGMGIDFTEDQKIEDTFLYPKSVKGPDIQQKSITISAKGNTVHTAREQVDRKIAEKLDASKNRFFLFGEKLAAHGVYSVLDIIYRDAKGPSNAQVAVVKGRAKEALFLHPKDTYLTSEYYPKLLKSAEKAGLIQNHTIQSICTAIFATGKDFMIPFITINKPEQRANITGLAMFHHDKFVGTLNITEAKMFLLLMNAPTHQHISFNLKIHENEKKREKSFINVVSSQIHSDMKIHHNSNAKLGVRMNLKVKFIINEYAKDGLTNPQKIEDVSRKIQKQLTQLANRTVSKMQQVNCDGLGIGQNVQAYHADTWKHINWDTVYPHLPIKIHITTEIVNHGVIN